MLIKKLNKRETKRVRFTPKQKNFCWAHNKTSDFICNKIDWADGKLYKTTAKIICKDWNSSSLEGFQATGPDVVDMPIKPGEILLFLGFYKKLKKGHISSYPFAKFLYKKKLCVFYGSICSYNFKNLSFINEEKQ